MESTFFTEDLLSKSLMPFIRETFPDGHRFQQDNDPKHTSKLTQKFIDDNNINWWKTPPESPDMNPIELVWHEMKHYLRKHVKPKTKEELMAGLEKFWEERMTPDKCAKYISHLRKVIPKVIEREGRASGYEFRPTTTSNGSFGSHQINKRYDQMIHFTLSLFCICVFCILFFNDNF